MGHGSVSKAAFFHSFLFSTDLPFFTERRRKKKPTQQETVQGQVFFYFLGSFKEKNKSMKDCFTLGMLGKDLSHSDITLYWTKGEKGRNERGVVNLKTHFPQGFCRIIQTSLFKSL